MPRPSQMADRLASRSFNGYDEDAEHASAAGFGEGLDNKWEGSDGMFYELLPSGHLRVTRPQDGASAIYPKDSLAWQRAVTDYSALDQSMMGREYDPFPYSRGQGQIRESVPDELLATIDPAKGPAMEDVPLPSIAETLAASRPSAKPSSSVSTSPQGTVDTNPPLPPREVAKAPKPRKRATDEDWPTLAEAKAKKAESKQGNSIASTLSSALGF